MAVIKVERKNLKNKKCGTESMTLLSWSFVPNERHGYNNEADFPQNTVKK